MSVTHDPRLDQGQEVGILIALMDEEISVGDELAEGILLCIEEADEDIWDVSWMDVPGAEHVVSWKMGALIPDSTLWLEDTFLRSRLDCGDPNPFLKGEIKEALRSTAGDLLANRLG